MFFFKTQRMFGVQNDSGPPALNRRAISKFGGSGPLVFGLTEGLLLTCCCPGSLQVDHQPSAIAEPFETQNGLVTRQDGGPGRVELFQLA